MLACCLLGKYCQSKSFLTCKAPSSASHDWRSVLVGRDLLTLQLGWMVGTGERISIWDDPWLSHSEQLRPVGPTTEETRLLKVSDLVLTGTVSDGGKGETSHSLNEHQCYRRVVTKCLLFSCPFAVKVWSLAPLAHPVTSTSFLTTRDGWETLRKLPTLPPVGLGPRTLASWIVWSLWTSRNQLIFEKRTYTAEETIQKALREAREWMTA